MELMIRAADPMPEEKITYDFKEPCVIFFEVTGWDQWDNAKVDIHGTTGGAACYEHDYGALDYVVAEQLEKATLPGFYVMDGFDVWFTCDYEGHRDSDHACGPIRPANTRDALYWLGEPCIGPESVADAVALWWWFISTPIRKLRFAYEEWKWQREQRERWRAAL